MQPRRHARTHRRGGRIARLWKRPRGPARQWLPPGAPDRPIQLALVDLRRELARVRERLDRLERKDAA